MLGRYSLKRTGIMVNRWHAVGKDERIISLRATLYVGKLQAGNAIRTWNDSFKCDEWQHCCCILKTRIKTRIWRLELIKCSQCNTLQPILMTTMITTRIVVFKVGCKCYRWAMQSSYHIEPSLTYPFAVYTLRRLNSFIGIIIWIQIG